jgi:tetratricopeptide (TPR) repeat protein
MAEQLGEQVREDFKGALLDADWTSSSESLARNLTESVDAYRAYVQGESLLQRAEFEGAADEFEEAGRIDPDFALAHFRLSMAARWLSDGVRAHQAARRAVSMVEHAPTSFREVIRANALYQEGAYSQAIPLLETVLARDPNLKEGLYILSQIYVHSARDCDTRRAIELMEWLLDLDPEFHLVYDRLALSYAFQGDFETAREKLSLWEDVRPDKVEGIRSVLATLEGQPEEAIGFGQAFTWIEGPLFMSSAAMLASRWDVALRMVALDPDEWRTEHLRAWSFRNQGTLYTYLGELDKAEQAYRQAGRVAGFRVHEGGSGGVPASALQSLAELLELRGDVFAARREAEQALGLQPESARGLYFAGRYALREDDPEAAEQYLGRLSGLPSVSTSDSIAMYQKALEAEIDLYRGRPQKSAEKLEVLVSSGRLLVDWPTTCSSSGAAFRETLYRAYVTLGEKDKAVRALEELLASGFERVEHPTLYVRTLYELGVSKIESGDTERGEKLLLKFLEHWGDSSWELPQVEDARSRIEKLSR